VEYPTKATYVGFWRTGILVVLDVGKERVNSIMCLQDLVPSWLEVRVLSSSVYVVSRATSRRRPPKSLAKVSLRYISL